MADTLTPRARSERMSRVRAERNESTELRLLKLLRVEGIRGWRRKAALIGKPDFVFRRERVVVFVDGCFWHGCPRHARVPKSRLPFWVPKLGRNKARDRTVNRALRAAGWRVIRVWECTLSAKRQRTTIRRIARVLSLGYQQSPAGRNFKSGESSPPDALNRKVPYPHYGAVLRRKSAPSLRLRLPRARPAPRRRSGVDRNRR